MLLITPENLFSLIQAYLPANPVIVEAGAFDGKTTKKMLLAWPCATIHCFEPVPEIFNELCRQTAAFSLVKQHQIGLSNHQGNATFYVAEHPKKPGKICQAGSLCKPKDRLTISPIFYPKTITIETTTLDTWAQENAINTIDFLWLDLQGHELAALQGAQQLLPTIKAIYIEVNFIEAYENQPSHISIHNWLNTHGFTPVAQDFTDEKKWFFGNVLYINKNTLAAINHGKT